MAEELEAATAYVNLLPGARDLQKDTTQAVKKVKAPDIIAKIDAELSGLQKKRGEAEQILSGLREKVVAQADLDITVLEARKKIAEGKLAELDGKKASPEAELRAAKLNAEIGRINSSLSTLNARKASPEVDPKVAKASADLSKIDRQMTVLQSRRASVEISESGGAGTVAVLDAVESKRRQVNGSRAAVNIAAAGGAQASGMLGLVVAGIAAVAAAAPAAVAGLGAVLGAASALGQAGGAAAAGFSGIGDAIKAVESDEKSAATSSAGAASSRVSSANQIASAQSSLAAAVTQADRAAITGGQQVASARRALADAVVSSADRTSDAERSVGRAQDSARYSQESLTRARRAAIEANQDLQLSLSGAAIAERRAMLALEKAQDARSSGGEVDPEKYKGRELDLDVAEADQSLKEVRERLGDLRGEQAQWARGGVEGSDEVVAAQRAVRDANLGVEDSQRSLARSQRDGARQVQEASAQVALAQQQAGWAQQDAARGVTDAQRGLQQALDSTAAAAGGAGSAGKQSAYELGQLTPAGRAFVAFWTGEWKPAMGEVSDEVAGQMLPRVERGMRQLLGLQPELKAGLGGTGAVLGDLAVKGSDLATSPAFRASFVQIMDSNNRALGSWGNAALSGADSARALTVAGLPLSERLARLAEGSAQSAESAILQAESTGELGRMMDFGAEKAGQLVAVVVDVAEAGYRVGVAWAPVGEVVLDVVSGVAEMVGEFAEGNVGMTQFLLTAGLAVAGTNALAKGVVALGTSYGIARQGASTLLGIISTGLNPAALYNTQVMSRMRDSATSGAAAAGTLTQGLTGSARAGQIAEKTTSGFARVASGLGASLPLVGTALIGVALLNDALNTSFDEGVEKMRKGGAAAEEFRAEMQRNDAAAEASSGVTNWIRSNVFGVQTTAEFTQNLRKQADQWTYLEKAQYNASVAQGNYELIAKRFGATSMEAGVFLAQWRDATRDVEIAQIAVREKTDLATAALLWQRDQILASLDADLRLRVSKQQLAKDQQALADAIKNSGADSQEANDAQLQLEQTQLRTAEAAKSSAGGQRAYVDAVRDMVAASKGELTPTLAGMVQSLDGAGLAAIGAKVHIDDTGRAIATLPNGQTITLDTNTSPALTGIEGVKYQLGLVPPGKTVTVTALDEVAQQKLRDLGFTVTQIPGTKNVEVTANDAQARGTLTAFQMFAAWQVANPQLAADPARANQAMRDFLAQAGQQTGVPMLDADPARADVTVRNKLDEFNRWNAKPSVDIDTRPAETTWQAFTRNLQDWSGYNLTQRLLGRADGGPIPGRRDGGLIEGYANGGQLGRIQHKQVFTGMAGGGKVRGPGGPRADRVPLMGSAGEYMVNAHAVGQPGVLPLLETINGMRDGGLVGAVLGYAGGGQVRPAAATGAPAAGAVAVPSADPASAQAAAGATAGLAGAMGLASGAAGALAPQLAGVTAQQQAMVASGVAPLAGALVGQLVPAVAAGNAQIGVQAPLAHQALQGAQLATQLSTTATAGNAAVNNAGIAATTTGMSLASQAQHAGLRAGQVATQVSTGITAAQMAGSNVNMQATTGQMSAVNQGHLAGLRGAQGVTIGSTVGFADAWATQLGRTVPASSDPLRHVINVPIRGVVEAWNVLDQQFAMNKHVNPYVAGFERGGQVFDPSFYGAGGRVTGGTPGKDSVRAMLKPGEVVWSTPAVDNVGGPAAAQAMHLAARSGQLGPYGAAHGIPVKRKDVGPLIGYADGGLVQMFDQGGLVAFGRRLQSMGYDVAEHPAFGGVGDHGPRSLHYSGNAIDVNKGAGTSPAEQAALSQIVPLARGYGLRTIFMVEGHYNHAHFDTGQGADMRGGPGGGGGGFDVTPLVEDAFRRVYEQIDEVPRLFGPSDQVARGALIARAGADGVKGKAIEKLTEMFAVPSGGPGAEQWRGVALEALRRTGQRLDLVDRVLQQIQIESSGNPRSINLWDINARRGHPSKGLIQTIDPTFQAYRDRSLPNDPYDPLANLVAGIRYAVATYGGIERIWPKKMGYHDGGRIPGRDEGLVFAQGGERVLSREQNVGFERMVDAGFAGFPDAALDVETRSFDTLTRTVGRDGPQIDLSEVPAAGGTTTHQWFPNATIREEVDMDLAMRRADFALNTATF